MFDFMEQLRRLTEKWRSTGEQAKREAEDIPNLLARGHLYGVSDGLDIAAEDVNTLLDQPGAALDPRNGK